MATRSGILAWRIPRTEEPDRLQSRGITKSRTRLSAQHSLSSDHFSEQVTHQDFQILSGQSHI